MKALLLSLVLLISPLNGLAQTFFQIDSHHSFASSRREIQNVSGILSLQEKFSDSKLELNSPNLSFRSQEISGFEKEFEVKGEIEQNGIRREVVLKGSLIIGNTGRVLAKLHSEELSLHLLASRPENSKTAIFKEVQDIIQ